MSLDDDAAYCLVFTGEGVSIVRLAEDFAEAVEIVRFEIWMDGDAPPDEWAEWVEQLNDESQWEHHEGRDYRFRFSTGLGETGSLTIYRIESPHPIERLKDENASLRDGKADSECNDWPLPNLYSVALLCRERGHERSAAVCHAGAIEIERLEAENAALRAVVDKLPRQARPMPGDLSLWKKRMTGPPMRIEYLFDLRGRTFAHCTWSDGSVVRQSEAFPLNELEFARELKGGG